MIRSASHLKTRGYFAIGIENGKTAANVGSLWRSAYNLGASYIFTIGQRYRHECTDTMKAWRSIPLFHHETFEAFEASIPADCRLVGVEYPHQAARPIQTHAHFERAIYLMGAEDRGLSDQAIERCDRIVYIPTRLCMNVSAAASVVMYDRMLKQAQRLQGIAQ
jgi:tRNA (guanosine-2'-O-)-methyltransferase